MVKILNGTFINKETTTLTGLDFIVVKAVYILLPSSLAVFIPCDPKGLFLVFRSRLRWLHVVI